MMTAIFLVKLLAILFLGLAAILSGIRGVAGAIYLERQSSDGVNMVIFLLGLCGFSLYLIMRIITGGAV